MTLFVNHCLDYCLNVSHTKTKVFFELLNNIFCNTEVYTHLDKIMSVDQLVSWLCKMIIDREINEIRARDEDFTLSGLFVFTRNVLDKFTIVREDFSEKNFILRYLVHEGLFHKETKGQLINKKKAMPPKCKNNSTRENCLKLVHVLCINNQEGMHVLIRYLRSYIGETFWRTNRKADWGISVH